MEEVQNKTDISDIEIQRCDDHKERHILNSPNKIIRWIKFKFEEQEIVHNRNKDSGLPLFKYIDLSNCIINTFVNEGNPSLTNLCDILSENEKVDLLDCFISNGYGNQYYQEVLERFFCKNSIIYAAFFHNTKFHKEVDFEGTEFNGHASFGGCLFEKSAWFQQTKFSGNFGFDRCIFENVVYFSNAELAVQQINFSNSIFKNDFDARNLTITTREISAFRPYITFAGAQFLKEFNFSNNDFALDIHFSNAKFQGNCFFSKCNFRKNSNFDDTEITGQLLFTSDPKEKKHSEAKRNIIDKISFNRSDISGRIDFEYCEVSEMNMNFTTIKADGIFRIYESRLSHLDMTSLSNKGTLMLEDNQNEVERITLKSAINTGVIEIENTLIRKIDDRITARLLKDSALKNGNTINALEYRKKEMELLKKENSSLDKESRFLLWLNEKSNNHGTSGIKGVWFTIECWIGFYLLFLIISRVDYILILFSTKNAIEWTFAQDISNGISYLWSLDFLGTLSKWIDRFKFNDAWWLMTFKSAQLVIGIIIYIVGKIAIGFGIYQTISAFRKYGKL